MSPAGSRTANPANPANPANRDNRRATLIYNPHAGFDDWQQQIDAVAGFWRAEGWQVTPQTTQGPGHATELAAAAAAAGEQMVLSAGGDGTLHEIVQGLVGTPCILAPLPAGTTNCLTRDLGLPKPGSGDPHWLLHAARSLRAGRVQAVDVGTCRSADAQNAQRDRRWLLWAGVGIESRIVEFVEPRSAPLKRFGVAGYIAKAAWPFLTFGGLDARVVVDSYAVEGHFVSVTVCNSRVFAGGLLNLNPRGTLDDGELEVWVLGGRFAAHMALHSLAIARGAHAQQHDIFCLKGRRVTIETREPQPFHLDGELHRSTPLTCEVLPRSLRLLAPATAPAGLFSLAGEGL